MQETVSGIISETNRRKCNESMSYNFLTIFSAVYLLVNLEKLG